MSIFRKHQGGATHIQYCCQKKILHSQKLSYSFPSTWPKMLPMSQDLEICYRSECLPAPIVPSSQSQQEPKSVQKAINQRQRRKANGHQRIICLHGFAFLLHIKTAIYQNFPLLINLCEVRIPPSCFPSKRRPL